MFCFYFHFIFSEPTYNINHAHLHIYNLLILLFVLYFQNQPTISIKKTEHKWNDVNRDIKGTRRTKKGKEISTHLSQRSRTEIKTLHHKNYTKLTAFEARFPHFSHRGNYFLQSRHEPTAYIARRFVYQSWFSITEEYSELSFASLCSFIRKSIISKITFSSFRHHLPLWCQWNSHRYLMHLGSARTSFFFESVYQIILIEWKYKIDFERRDVIVVLWRR